ncbi:Acyl-coenzyme A thioesterase 8 [Hondaea fermentalgiana]|uniref:Acyl-coenzyme A thioesterase 8 n=1 Tax=Hondaea fermentalgiana TaxID=2315210 RepID=A0A2R5GAI0_9STRA|nr:Acyl-coenzyme A thioesterase 8 [Hondaea fermentalgiana]|eukprot:GBG26748.1 Acyl-coenzyme A thioesterase 8 [Hondaea fermentalgiana]
MTLVEHAARAGTRARTKAGTFRDLSLQDFVAHLSVKPLGRDDDAGTAARGADVFEARSNQDFGWGRLFGGQPMGQSLAAASLTVPESMTAHWMSCMFVREGMCDELPRFAVERVRDGRSFASRRVRAFQGHGDILDMLVNFHVEEPGFEHQARPVPPGLVSPQDLGPNRARYEAFAKSQGKTIDEVLPKPVQYLMLDEEQPILVRPGLLRDVAGSPEALDPHQHSWMKVNGPGGKAKADFYETIADEEAPADLRTELTDEQLSQAMLAFMVDFGFLGTSLLPHKKSVWQKTVMAASLTHSMHFHKPIAFCGPEDESPWLLFDQESPTATTGRGFVSGEIYNANTGTLVATALQEGLVRPVRPKKT